MFRLASISIFLVVISLEKLQIHSGIQMFD